MRLLIAPLSVLFCLFVSASLPGQQPQYNGQQPVQQQQQPAQQQQQVQSQQAQPGVSPAEQQFIDQVLKYWEFRSAKIERYRCKFQRWDYDPVFGPKNPEHAKTYSTGVIKYEVPDKGLYKVEKLLHYTPPKTAEEQPQWLEREGVFGEEWICDGQSVFEINHEKKQIIERELPPDMQGTAIAEGPLPFMFGAKADQIKARYWLKVITPAEVKDEYWLEARPKTRHDAANFKMVHIIIDQAVFLPKAIQIFDPNYDERRNPARSVIVFEEREDNWQDNLARFNPLKKDFFRPATPRGWKKVVEPYQPYPGDDSTQVPTAQVPPAGPRR